MGPECFSLQSFDLHIATSKLKKPKVHLIIKKLFLTENESKKRCGCLTFIFCQKHFFMTGFAILMWQLITIIIFSSFLILMSAGFLLNISLHNSKAKIVFIYLLQDVQS